MNQPTEPEFLDDGGLKKPDRSLPRALIGENRKKLVKNTCVTSKTLRLLAVRKLAQYLVNTV